jgi:hypothetical protein
VPSLRAKRSNPGANGSMMAALAPGLLRRCAPRNDGPPRARHPCRAGLRQFRRTQGHGTPGHRSSWY